MAQEAEKQGDARQNNPLNNQCTLFSDFNLSKKKKLKKCDSVSCNCYFCV